MLSVWPQCGGLLGLKDRGRANELDVSRQGPRGEVLQGKLLHLGWVAGLNWHIDEGGDAQARAVLGWRQGV